jgi:hypothetical protein
MGVILDASLLISAERGHVAIESWAGFQKMGTAQAVFIEGCE